MHSHVSKFRNKADASWHQLMQDDFFAEKKIQPPRRLRMKTSANFLEPLPSRMQNCALSGADDLQHRR